MSGGKTPEHLTDFTRLCLVDIVFLTVLIDIINRFDVRVGLSVFDVFGHGSTLPPKNVKPMSMFPQDSPSCIF
jgi:hypothetical protein